jgi:ABC-type transport system substrate-binding protein
MIIPDASTQMASFRTGKIDMRSGITWEDFDILIEQAPDLVYVDRHGWGYVPCGRLDKDLPFNDLKVRQAMNMAVNQPEMVDDYYQGNA